MSMKPERTTIPRASTTARLSGGMRSWRRNIGDAVALDADIALLPGVAGAVTMRPPVISVSMLIGLLLFWTMDTDDGQWNERLDRR